MVVKLNCHIITFFLALADNFTALQSYWWRTCVLTSERRGCKHNKI